MTAELVPAFVGARKAPLHGISARPAVAPYQMNCFEELRLTQPPLRLSVGERSACSENQK